VDLRWTASTDNTSVAGYRILRNGLAVASVGSSVLTYSDTSVAAGGTYRYSVQAFDAARNASAASNSVPVTTPVAPAPVGCSPGVNVFTGCYFNNTDLASTPVLVRTDSKIEFDWTFTTPDRSLPFGNYSVRWQGNFSFQEGDHTFYASASDGMRIYVDGTLILDRWRDQPVYSYTIRRPMTAGVHLITVEYYQRTGTAIARLSWQKN
jgi:hypothetical protein